MPYEWLPPTPTETRLHLWPYRSLPKRGFVGFIGATAVLVAVPLLALVGSPLLWGVLPFVLAAISAIWWALARTYRDGEEIEEFSLFPDRVTLTRHSRNKPARHWEANPYWVSVHLYPEGGKVPNYLTLRGNGREVEVGAFLSEDERIRLRTELEDALRALTRPDHP